MNLKSNFNRRLQKAVQTFTKAQKDLEQLCGECEKEEFRLSKEVTVINLVHERALSISTKLKGLLE